MKKVIGTIFTTGLILSGCGVESVFGTPVQRVTWVAVFTVTIIAGFWLGKR